MTVDRSEAAGVSLEVGATYRAASETEIELLAVEPDAGGFVPVRRKASGNYGIAKACELVRVVPTPADVFKLLNCDGDEFGEFDDAEEALRGAEQRNETSLYAPYRVAKFAFVEYVGEQSDG